MSIAPATQRLHDVAAQDLIEMWRNKRALERKAAVAAGAGTLTGAQIDAILAHCDEIDIACEDFRSRFYPNAGRVFVAIGLVSTVSPKGRRSRIVFDPERVTR